MSAATLTPPPIAAQSHGPMPFRWTMEVFHQLGDRGLFEGRRAMLINGIILEQGPMNPPHARAVQNVMYALLAVFGTAQRLRVQLPLDFGNDTDPLPDLYVESGPAQSPLHPTTAALVVEVADTSQQFDTTTKAELYAAAGILDYWVLDVNARQLLIFRNPQPDPADATRFLYAPPQTLSVTDSISPLAAPTASIRIADLLP